MTDLLANKSHNEIEDTVPIVSIVAGGKERPDSVENALKALPRRCNIVCIHDAVRPCVNPALIDRAIMKAYRCGAAILAAPVRDTVKKASGRDFKVTEANPRPGDAPVLTSDAGKARRELGWTTEIPKLQDMVASAWRWHREHPDGYPE